MKFGTQMSELRKRLRREPQTQLFDAFNHYSADFRRRMSIQSEQALDLFYQTVSLKAVGNLTEFVRTHMLEAPPVAARIQDMCNHFDNLNRAPQEVLRARDQIDQLTPLVADGARYTEPITLTSSAAKRWRSSSASRAPLAYMGSSKVRDGAMKKTTGGR